ncbi:hypothetical protein O3M35_008818 [Rhynocoris fuscipes]|uniref:Uncharacterized protein n=1 Tax=Rhynocoris fuscipes TaxID=488301 RepID=A0AAW1DEL2_9HEMI
MDNNSPSTYGPPNWATGVNSSNFKSPISNSPQSSNCQESPDFSPYSYSSPIKHYSRNNKWNNRRYFNSSTGTYNNSGNFSPSNSQHFYNRRNRGKQNRQGNDSSDNSHISLYFHPSMLEDPWKELEKQLKESSVTCEKTNLPEDLKNDDTSVQN